MANTNGYTNLSDIKSVLKVLYFGEVVYVDDANMMGTIKVRIPEIDNNIPTENLPFCYRLNNFMSVSPKMGERVAVLFDRYHMSDKNTNQEKRYWFAVLISTPERYNEDKYYYTASAHETDGFLQIDNPISRNPSARGVYHDRTTLGINGRDNSDMLFRRGEVLIRAGQHEIGDYPTFNKSTTAYIQIKHNEDANKNQRSKKVIDEIITIPCEFEIRVITDNANNLSIKIIRYLDMEILEEFSNGYPSRDEMLFEGKKAIKSFQEKYQKWFLKTIDIDFNKLPKIFANSQITIQKEVEVDTPTSEIVKSCINVVAGKINLVSHHKGTKYNLFNQEEQITAQEQERLNKELSPSVKGDVLLEVLNLFKSYINTHTHAYHKLPAVNDDIVKQINNYDLTQILTDNIRIG